MCYQELISFNSLENVLSSYITICTRTLLWNFGYMRGYWGGGCVNKISKEYILMLNNMFVLRSEKIKKIKPRISFDWKNLQLELTLVEVKKGQKVKKLFITSCASLYFIPKWCIFPQFHAPFQRDAMLLVIGLEIENNVREKSVISLNFSFS